MGVRLETLCGGELAEALPAVARLRIEVFRDWPYLYDGNYAYEKHYLAELARAPDAVIVAARDGSEIVGASTAAPLVQHSPQFAPLFADRGIDPATVFYFGESVLLSAWRGKRLGHGFFDYREAAARAARTADGRRYGHAAFCGVVRAADDRRRPADYTSLEAFWTKRGFAPVVGMVGSYAWKEIDADGETEHPMQFWLKALT